MVKLTDVEAIEAQCVENLQREGIHPLEEALGFKSLLELGEPVYTIATIASRAGKSEAYVYRRVRLWVHVRESIPQQAKSPPSWHACRDRPGLLAVWKGLTKEQSAAAPQENRI